MVAGRDSVAREGTGGGQIWTGAHYGAWEDAAGRPPRSPVPALQAKNHRRWKTYPEPAPDDDTDVTAVTAGPVTPPEPERNHFRTATGSPEHVQLFN